MTDPDQQSQQPRTGLVHVYTGTGKGKTTADSGQPAAGAERRGIREQAQLLLDAGVAALEALYARLALSSRL